MPEYRRPRSFETLIFFTVALATRSSDLLTGQIDRLREAVSQTRAERPFGIEAWIVLPDHLHCMWTLPGGDRDYATRWRLIKTRFSCGLPMGERRPSHIARNERGIWQRGFWEHHIRDEHDMAAHLLYCWFNPVKHGLVQRTQDWPYSSVHREFRSGRWEWAMSQGVEIAAPEP
ncbi:MAG TPA: transposase [Paracoccus sp. (in: a-proteobacteria)]|nr:transposase [Paracoccus sp. (in: a-proteobacteria)]